MQYLGLAWIFMVVFIALPLFFAGGDPRHLLWSAPLVWLVAIGGYKFYYGYRVPLREEKEREKFKTMSSEEIKKHKAGMGGYGDRIALIVIFGSPIIVMIYFFFSYLME